MKKQIGKKLWLKGLEHVVTSAVENKSKVHQGLPSTLNLVLEREDGKEVTVIGLEATIFQSRCVFKHCGDMWSTEEKWKNASAVEPSSPAFYASYAEFNTCASQILKEKTLAFEKVENGEFNFSKRFIGDDDKAYRLYLVVSWDNLSEIEFDDETDIISLMSASHVFLEKQCEVSKVDTLLAQW